MQRLRPKPEGAEAKVFNDARRALAGDEAQVFRALERSTGGRIARLDGDEDLFTGAGSGGSGDAVSDRHGRAADVERLLRAALLRAYGDGEGGCGGQDGRGAEPEW